MSQYREADLDKQDSVEIKNYTRTPNMLIFGYQDNLSPQEKWLYVCLKHMCGKKGTRHLALRYISDVTGISTGALSTSKNKKGEINLGMIRHLHDAGLIHAEIKRPGGKGNSQYHITITDVWALNQAFFSKTRSDFGQDEDTDAEPVRNSDEPVQISDKSVQNSDEPVRNSDNTNTRYKTNTKTTEQEEGVGSLEPTAPANVYHIQEKRQRRGDTDKHKAVKIGDTHADTLPVDIPDSPGSSTGDDAVSQEQEASQERQQALTASSQRAATEKAAGQSELNTPKRKGKRVTQAIEPEAVRIMDDWDSLFKRPSPRTDNHIKAAESLIASNPTKEDLDSVRKFCFSSNPEWYRNKGVTLIDVSRNFGKWQSLQDVEQYTYPLKAVANGDVAPQEDDDYSGFDIYKGNGKEERAAMRALYEVMEANGELI